MELTVYTREDGFAALRPEWDDLLGRSRFDTIFLTWEWQFTWWQHLGSDRGGLYLLAVRDEGRLLGIIPLYTSSDSDVLTLQVVGCIEVSDYLDFIIEAGQEEPVYRAFLAWLAGPDAPAWDLVDLCNQPGKSLSHELLPGLAESAGYAVEVFLEDVCPVITLPAPCPASDPDCTGGWERYLETLDKKERHEIRRKLRRIERDAPDASVRFVSDGPGLEAAVEAFIGLHRNSRADKHAFMTEQMQAYFRAIALALAPRGWLQLSFLDIDQQAVASYFCFDYNNQVLVYNSGYDPAAVPQLSPGWVLLARLIQHAINEGRERFDFLQGDEDYKHRFGGVDEPVHRTIIRRR